LAMTAEPVTAQQALQMNLITQISENPMDAALQFGEQLKQRSPDTNKAIKRLYHQIGCPDAGKILAGETINQWKMIFGKNRQIAVKRQLGSKDIDYQ